MNAKINKAQNVCVLLCQMMANGVKASRQNIITLIIDLCFHSRTHTQIENITIWSTRSSVAKIALIRGQRSVISRDFPLYKWAFEKHGYRFNEPHFARMNRKISNFAQTAFANHNNFNSNNQNQLNNFIVNNFNNNSGNQSNFQPKKKMKKEEIDKNSLTQCNFDYFMQNIHTTLLFRFFFLLSLHHSRRLANSLVPRFQRRRHRSLL